jgi:hypothetical protein
MLKPPFGILGAATIIGAVLIPTAASAAVTAHARASSGPDPNTTVTFAVTSGALTMTAPASANLGSGAPGTTINGSVGAVVVTDDRALLAAVWTAVASSSAFVTGGSTPAETIPATDVGYNPGTPTTTGVVTNVTGLPITLSNTPQPVVTLTGVGNNTASWNPALAVAVPAAAVVGTYTATLTQSVS